MSHNRTGRKRHHLIFIAATSTLAGSLILAPNAVAAESNLASERSTFFNTAENVASDRPVLDSIKESAESAGIPLEEAIATYISDAEVASPPSPESQPDGPVDTPDVMIDDLTAGELEDIQAVAEGEGISFSDAIDQHGWQNKFVEVAEELETSFPEEFSGAVKSEDGAWFAFKGKAPSEALKLASSLPVPVEVVNHRGFSEADLAVAQKKAHDDVMAQSNVDSAITAYDVKAGEVKVEVKLDRVPTTSAARSATARSLTPTREDLGLSVPVRVEISGRETLEKQDGYIRGGGYLSVGCTSGFNLKYISSDTKRLGTAGHCTTASSMTYSNHATHGGSTSVSTVWSHQGSGGDLGYTSKGSLASTRTFYQDYNNSRYADDRASMPAVGTTICKFGRTSGKTCSSVKYRNVSVGGLQHMVVMNGNACQGGDSGGPWYYGGTAYGIHTGLTNYDGTNRCLFTPAYLFQNKSYDVWTR